MGVQFNSFLMFLDFFFKRSIHFRANARCGCRKERGSRRKRVGERERGRESLGDERKMRAGPGLGT